MKSFKSLALIACVSALALSACATSPGGRDPVLDLAVQSATLVAVDRVVTRDHATPADVEVRALRIVNVATALKAAGADSLSTLPLIKAQLAPLLDGLNLSPLERAQASLLVDALVRVGLERTDVSKYVARVEFILDQVITAASAYLPPAPEPSTL